MSRPKRIFPNRVFLMLASVATGVSGIFSIYIVDGYSVSSAFSLAWPLGAVFSGGIAAPVIVGPLLTLWSFREVCILDTPHDGTLTVLAIGLPSIIVLIVAAGFTFARARSDGDVQVWPLTFLTAPLTHAGLMVSAGWLSA